MARKNRPPAWAFFIRIHEKAGEAACLLVKREKAVYDHEEHT